MAARRDQSNRCQRSSTYEPGMASKAAVIWEAGGNNKEVAEALGIHVRTLQAWLKSFPPLAEAKECAGDHLERKLMQSLLEVCNGTEKVEFVESYIDGQWVPTSRKTTSMPADPKAIQFWLQSRLPHRWKQRQEIEVSVDRSLVEELNEGRERLQKLIAGIAGAEMMERLQSIVHRTGQVFMDTILPATFLTLVWGGAIFYIIWALLLLG